jgi:hypothetical protein
VRATVCRVGPPTLLDGSRFATSEYRPSVFPFAATRSVAPSAARAYPLRTNSLLIARAPSPNKCSAMPDDKNGSKYAPEPPTTPLMWSRPLRCRMVDGWYPAHAGVFFGDSARGHRENTGKEEHRRTTRLRTLSWSDLPPAGSARTRSALGRYGGCVFSPEGGARPSPASGWGRLADRKIRVLLAATITPCSARA